MRAKGSPTKASFVYAPFSVHWSHCLRSIPISSAQVVVRRSPCSSGLLSRVSPVNLSPLKHVFAVNDLSEASKSIATLQALLNHDMASNCTRNAGSHSRNLLRVKRGLDMVWVLFEQILIAEGNSLKDPASKAYAQVFAPHHGWAIRKAVAAGMYPHHCFLSLPKI